MVGLMDVREMIRLESKKSKLELAKVLYELYTMTGDIKHKELADSYLQWSKRL